MKGDFIWQAMVLSAPGNMGGAVAKAAAKAVGGGNLFLANRTPAKAEALAAELGGQACDNGTAARQDYIFLGVKPQMMAGMLEGIQSSAASRCSGSGWKRGRPLPL